MKIPERDDFILGTPALPSFIEEIRPHQWQAVEEVIDAYASGSDVVFLSAPTGSGKSLLGELVRRMMDTRAVYLCNSIALQHQFANDYPYSKLLKGRSNYPTLIAPFPAYTAGDCDKTLEQTGRKKSWSCSYCPSVGACPYNVARDEADEADLAVTNTAYFLHAANFAHRLIGRGLVIADEGDELEDQMMNFAEFRLYGKQARELGLSLPGKGVRLPTLSAFLDTVINRTEDELADSGIDNKEKRKWERLLGSAQLVADNINDGTYVRDYSSPGLVLKPVTVAQYGNQLWEHGRKWLVMSATLISPEVLAMSTGLDKRYSVVNVPSTFPVENRRVKVAPVANMVAKEKVTEWPKCVAGIVAILAKHPHDRVLVHTVSYELANFIVEGLGKVNGHRQIVTYTKAADKDTAIERFRETSGAVLVAASVERGLDLPDDQARVVIVCKVPFPNLGDRQISTRIRLPGGQMWYDTQTVRALVQMTGRATRHADDWSVTYILDRKFIDLYKKRKAMFPQWWAESVDFNVNVKEFQDAG